MLNLTSNQITQWTTTEERYVLTNEQGGGQCDELVFTVEAETDVGSTGPSTNTTGGFLRGTNRVIEAREVLSKLCRYDVYQTHLDRN